MNSHDIGHQGITHSELLSNCSSTEVTMLRTGEKVPVLCRLDDAHKSDHEGRFDGGMLLRWPRLPTPPIVIRIDSVSVPVVVLQPQPEPRNAACVIGLGDEPYTTAPRFMASAAQSWATKPSNPVDDIRAAAEHMRRVRLAGPQKRTPLEQARYDHLGGLLSAAAARLPFPEPFPIQDAGPHPKDADPFAEVVEFANRESAKALLSAATVWPTTIQHPKDGE